MKTIEAPKTPAGRLAAIKRAEKILGPISSSHPANSDRGDGYCKCELCDIVLDLWRLRREIEHPGIRSFPWSVE